MNYTEKIVKSLKMMDEGFVERLTGKEPGKKFSPANEVPAAAALLVREAIAMSKQNMLYLGGELRVFNGKYYEVGGDDFLKVVVEVNKMLQYPLSAAYNPNFIRSFDAALSGLLKIREDQNEVPNAINFRDGVLHITPTSMKFSEEHSPDDVFTYCLPFGYKGALRASRHWDAFIKKAIPEDDYRNYVLASMCNAIALDPMKAQRMTLLIGVGASGKSTLIDAIRATLGDDNVCSVDDLQNLTKDDSRYRLSLASSILCTCGDASGNIGNKDVLKQIISKEELAARQLYKEIEYFKPRASLIVASNEMGFTHALGDSGISRRVDIIEFRHPVAEEDRDPLLSEKLKQPNEQRKMVMDMIEALKEQQKTGRLERPERMKIVLDELRYNGDTFLSFVSHAGLDFVTTSEDPDESRVEWIHQDDLLQAYQVFATNNGNARMSMRSFKAKFDTNNCLKRGRRGSKHDYALRIMDQAAYTQAMFLDVDKGNPNKITL